MLYYRQIEIMYLLNVVYYVYYLFYFFSRVYSFDSLV
jgi:hypothetical protein